MICAGKINANDSLFTYVPGQLPATFDNPDFTPIFDASDLPFANMSGLVQICGDSLECLFDVGATGDFDVGMVAVEVQIEYSETVEDSQLSKCMLPGKLGLTKIHATIPGVSTGCCSFTFCTSTRNHTPSYQNHIQSYQNPP